jgi:alpha-L-fucosidase
MCKAPRRPDDFQPYVYEKSLEELRRSQSDALMAASARAVAALQEGVDAGPYSADVKSLSAHETPEWYVDAKFGVSINYSLYSVIGFGGQGYAGNRYTDCYLDQVGTSPAIAAYHNEHWGADFKRDDCIPLMTAENFDAEAYADLIAEAGAQFVLPFQAHRSTGFMLWKSRVTHRNAFDMPPHRDLTGEIVQACRARGLRHALYLNLEDTAYPLIADDGSLVIREWTHLTPKDVASKLRPELEVTHPYDSVVEARDQQGKIPVRDFVADYVLPWAKEFIDNYEPDYIWFDGGWKRPAAYYRSMEIVAYYYNKFEGAKDVLVSRRVGNDLYGVLGDVTISEGGAIDGGKPCDCWEENAPMGQNFAYDWRENDANTHSATELIHALIRITARGGTFNMIVTPDGSGRIPDHQRQRLRAIGAWLQVCGEGIYATRPSPYYCEDTNYGQNVFYTQSKDGSVTYAICLKLESSPLVLLQARAQEDSTVRMLGVDEPLEWFNGPWGPTISLPEHLLDAQNRPCRHAWVIRFLTGDRSDGPAIQSE